MKWLKYQAGAYKSLSRALVLFVLRQQQRTARDHAAGDDQEKFPDHRGLLWFAKALARRRPAARINDSDRRKWFLATSP